jgi:hypothetical protein
LARELIRNIQALRKKNDLKELQRINVEVSRDPAVEKMLSEFQDMVLSEVRGDQIQQKDGLESKELLDYEGRSIYISIRF